MPNRKPPGKLDRCGRLPTICRASEAGGGSGGGAGHKIARRGRVALRSRRRQWQLESPPMAGRSSSEYELVYDEYEPPSSSACFDGGERCGGNGGGGVNGGGGGGGTRTPDLCSPRANTLPTLPLGVAGPPLRLLEPAAALPTAGTLLLEPVALPTAGAPFCCLLGQRHFFVG